MTREMIHIEGMSCGHCVAAVRQALASVEGVTVHAVEIGAADLSYDPTRTPRARLIEAVEDAGYAVSVQSSSSKVQSSSFKVNKKPL